MTLNHFVRKLLEKEGKAATFSDMVTVNVTRSLFEAPAINKRIVDVGFLVKPAGTAPLGGVARLEVSFKGAAPVRIATNDKGIAATDSNPLLVLV
jgi:hypothetical protein